MYVITDYEKWGHEFEKRRSAMGLEGQKLKEKWYNYIIMSKKHGENISGR